MFVYHAVAQGGGADGTGIDHFQSRAQLPGHHADGGAAGDEVGNHLCGDRLGKQGNALVTDTMVTGKNRNLYLLCVGGVGALQGGQPNGHVFQFAQRTGRFGQLRLACQCPLAVGVAGGGKLGEPGG